MRVESEHATVDGPGALEGIFLHRWCGAASTEQPADCKGGPEYLSEGHFTKVDGTRP